MVLRYPVSDASRLQHIICSRTGSEGKKLLNNPLKGGVNAFCGVMLLRGSERPMAPTLVLGLGVGRIELLSWTGS